MQDKLSIVQICPLLKNGGELNFTNVEGCRPRFVVSGSSSAGRNAILSTCTSCLRCQPISIKIEEISTATYDVGSNNRLTTNGSGSLVNYEVHPKEISFKKEP